MTVVAPLGHTALLTSRIETLPYLIHAQDIDGISFPLHSSFTLHRLSLL